MSIYLFYLALILIEAIALNINNSVMNKKIFIILSCSELILFVGLRAYDIGADTFGYLQIYEEIKSYDLNFLLFDPESPYDFEIGYMLLMKICSMLSLNKTGFLFVIAVIIYLPFFKLINNNSCYPAQSILIYFAFSMFAYSLGIFRQMIALSICLMLIPYIIERKPVKFFIGLVLAMSFHMTSFCWILLYIGYKIDLKKIKNLIIPASILCVFIGKYFVQLMLVIFPKYERYLGRVFGESGGSYIMLLILICITAITNLFFLNRKEFNSFDKLAVLGLYMAVILQSISYSFALIGRAIVYFSIFLCFLIPKIQKTIIKDNEQLLTRTVTTFMWLFLIIFHEFLNNNYICPFKFVWQM